jgi:hypothetical protein
VCLPGKCSLELRVGANSSEFAQRALTRARVSANARGARQESNVGDL